MAEKEYIPIKNSELPFDQFENEPSERMRKLVAEESAAGKNIERARALLEKRGLTGEIKIYD